MQISVGSLLSGDPVASCFLGTGTETITQDAPPNSVK